MMSFIRLKQVLIILVHPKMIILSLFTPPHAISNFLWNMKYFEIYFLSIQWSIVSGTQILTKTVSNILQNIFCVLQKKKKKNQQTNIIQVWNDIRASK